METKGIEPGLNYYLSDVILEMDPLKNMDEKDKCKNLKVLWRGLLMNEGLRLESS